MEGEGYWYAGYLLSRHRRRVSLPYRGRRQATVASRPLITMQAVTNKSGVQTPHLDAINREGSRCGICVGAREYRDRSHERRSRPPAEAVRSQRGAGHDPESISHGTGKILGAGSLDARSRDRASDGARRVCRGRDHRGSAGVQRRARILPGGACPGNPCRPEVAAGARLRRFGAMASGRICPPPSWCLATS